MSSPQKENGFSAISNELLEALAKIRIAGEARQVLDVIFRKTYGWNKKSDIISTSQFMELSGLDSYAIHRARKKLLDMNLISISNRGNSKGLTYAIQKDYDKWTSVPKRVYPKKVTVPNNGNSTQKRLRSVTNNGDTGVTNNALHNNNVKDNKEPSTAVLAALPPSALKYFYLSYKQKTGHDYIASFAKDGAIFKDLLKIIPEDEIKILINKFLDSNDEFIRTTGRTIGVFKTQINKLRTGLKPLSSGQKTYIACQEAFKKMEENKDAQQGQILEVDGDNRRDIW